MKDKKEKTDIKLHPNAKQIIAMAMDFLRLFFCETLVKRIVSAVLIAAGLPNAAVTEMTGLCDKSVRVLRKSIDAGDTADLLSVKGGGRKSKYAQFEKEIIEEISNNDYSSRQQIADMIQEKFGVKISVSAVGKLLKKTGFAG